MEVTKPASQLSSMGSNSSKDVEPLVSQSHSQMTCPHFGDFFRCPKPSNCPRNQECLRAWMQKAQEST